MDRETENPFAAVIRIMRGETPQGVFAEKLGLKQAKYSHYENRRREPSLDELCRIARALDTTPNVLLGFESPPISAAHNIKTGDIKGNSAPIVVGSNNTVIAPPSSSSSTKRKGRKR